MMEAAVAEAPMAEQVIGTAADEGARAVMEKAPEVIVNVTETVPNYALWFLFGCLFVIVLVVIFELIRAKKKDK